jgi:SAM-dependent methyltransferase
VTPVLPPTLRLVCPACRQAVRAEPEAYRCGACSRLYPVRLGIPDFRLRSDRYLSLEQEIDKATRLAEAARSRSFEQLLDHYYEITGDVPPELALRYKAAVLNAPRHLAALAADIAASQASRPDSLALDAGCGSGGLLIAAHQAGARMVGVDIALRWLVICRKRLDELGLDTPLVCADLADPPFAPASFGAVAAVDLVEHAHEVAPLLKSLATVAEPQATLWLTAANGRTLGPHPSTRLWAIGWLPAGLRRVVVQRLRGVDSLRFTHLLWPSALRDLARGAGLVTTAARPRRLAAADSRYPFAERVLISIYRALARWPLTRGVLVAIGPSFELELRPMTAPTPRRT